MFNLEIEKNLIEKFGKADYITFCKLEAEKNKLLLKDYKERNMQSWCYDCSFDAEWYEKRFNELNEKL